MDKNIFGYYSNSIFPRQASQLNSGERIKEKQENPSSFVAYSAHIANILSKRSFNADDKEEIRRFILFAKSAKYRSLQDSKNAIVSAFGTSKKITSSIETIVSDILYLKEDLHANVAKIIQGFPDLLDYSPQYIKSKVAWLSSNEGAGVKNVSHLIEIFPMALKYRIESMSLRVNFLHSLLDKDSTSDAIERFPTLLELAPEKMQANIDFLVGIGITDIPRIIKKHPQILAYSVESMKAKADMLIQSCNNNVCKIIEKSPQIFAYSEQTLRSRIANLQALSSGKARLAISRQPQLLELSPAYLEAKVEKLRKHGISTEDIFLNPIVLSYSLIGRIAPRLDYIEHEAHGANLQGSELIKLLKSDNSEFIERLSFLGFKPDLQEYLKYCAVIEGTEKLLRLN
ncbi:MAG: hypothetical protein ACP5RP_03630 [Candidatus Micrarchaeia archaeon]